MAKLTDKFFNRIIEGPFEPDSDDASVIAKSLEGKDIKVKKLESTSDAKVGGNLTVTGSINGESNPSVKPIYCHPISINNTDESQNKVHIAMLIFDNSNEEYNTLAKLSNKLDSIFALNRNAVFPVTGALYYGTDSALHVAQRIGLDSGNVKRIYTSRSNGTQGNFSMDSYLADCTIYDGVNKIN